MFLQYYGLYPYLVPGKQRRFLLLLLGQPVFTPMYALTRAMAL